MKNAILSLLLVAGAATLSAGCTAMCEDGCEQEHDISTCADGDDECVQRVAGELLACVQACN